MDIGRNRGRREMRGFSLIEMAVALFVLALLIGSILVPLSTQVESRKYDDTQQALKQAREALLGYVAATGRFPCPASATSNGAEHFFSPGGTANNGLCHSSITSAAGTLAFVGFLPAATLGITPVDDNGYAVDSWPRWDIGGVPQNRIRYAVARQTINSTSNCTATPVSLPFTKVDGMRTAGMSCIMNASSLPKVCNAAAGSTPTSCASGATLTANAIVVIWSLGPNASTSGGASADEAENAEYPFTSADQVFVSKVRSGALGNEFDDIVTWISPPELFNRMIAAGQLP